MSTVNARNISLRSHFGADKSAVALPTLYFALFNGDPEGAGVEPTSTGGYARKAVTNDIALWGTIGGSAVSVTNATDIVFATATGVYSQASLTHWAAFDNSAGGVLTYAGPLTATVAVSGAGDVPRIVAGGLTITQQ
jgi:hypothetical protein